MIHSPSVFDTDETRDLREHINRLEEEENRRRRDWERRQRDRLDLYEGLLLAQRPTYPTPEQIEGLDRVAAMVKAGTEYGDHFGWARRDQEEPLPRGVLFYSGTGRINVHADAPYRAVRKGGRLWEFTEEEIAAMREHLLSHGLAIGPEWDHDDGHAFVVAAKKEA